MPMESSSSTANEKENVFYYDSYNFHAFRIFENFYQLIITSNHQITGVHFVSLVNRF